MSAKDRTRSCIIDAFNDLIAHNNFNTITVAMICSRADIGRATFYRYFKDKYAVMNENYRILLAECARDESVHTYRDLFFRLYSEAHADFWLSIRKSFESVGYNSFRNYITEYSYSFAEEVTKKNRNGKSLTDTERMQLDVFSHGVPYMFESWTFKRYKISAEQAAQALYDCMPPSLKDCRIK